MQALEAAPNVADCRNGSLQDSTWYVVNVGSVCENLAPETKPGRNRDLLYLIKSHKVL